MVRGGLNEASKDSPQESLCCLGGESTVAWWLIRHAEAKRENLGQGSQRIANDHLSRSRPGCAVQGPEISVGRLECRCQPKIAASQAPIITVIYGRKATL